VALLELERGGLLHLPPAGPAPPKRTRRPLAEPFQQEPAIQCALSQLGDLTLVLIIGLQRLDDLTAMWKIATGLPSPPSPERAVSSEVLVDDG